MAICNHNEKENFAPDEILENLPDCQGGAGRHKCAICAYNQGIQDRKNDLVFSEEELQTCPNGRAAPEKMLKNLPKNQGSIARHKCCNTAYLVGYGLLLKFEKENKENKEETEILNELGDKAEDLTVNETKKYVSHRKLERASGVSKKVKSVQGYVCKVCDFSFQDAYGILGKEYIEAHHLKPLYALKEDEEAFFDLSRDFAVLCANCHRMIHRMDDVSDVNALRELVKSKKI